jgi:16S rRNA (guanine966-N2)-methyltransferase
VRIIAGTRKGHRILAPKGTETRPTGDRVREAAFTLIPPGFAEGASVLDVFAGSGAMGLEALSRGAERAVFVETAPEAVRAIERNLDRLRLTGASIVRRDARSALAAEAAAGRRYDLVFVDPPYEDWPELERSHGSYLASLVADNGLLVVETAARTTPRLPLTERTSRRYGSARLTLYERG